MADQKRFLDTAYSVSSDTETRQLYDRWAEVYDEELTENAYSQPQRCAEAMAGLADPDRTVLLDVGCGSGLSGIALTGEGFKTIDGCDFSPAMLSKAAKTNVYRRLVETNLNEPPMAAADGSYDGVTCVGVFSFGHVMADALDDICRVLKPGGALVIGLNDHFHREGSLTAKLSALEAVGSLSIVSRDHGDHIPGKDLTGWVINARKA
jgi:predicted TPR repeat methyltransferase